MDTIRTAVIGVGGMAQTHIERLLKHPHAEIAALVDISEGSLARTQERHGGSLADTLTFSDYREMLRDIKPQAVVICTPHTLHFAQAMDCLDAGAHVLCEKPMVTRVADAHALMAKVHETGLVLALAYQRHTEDKFRYIRSKITSGEFGAVQMVAALQQQGWKTGTAGTWRHDPALSGGGQINDSGSHLLDIVLWTTGLAPARVSAFMDNKGTPVDINSAVTVQFEGGAQGTFTVVGDAAGWHEDITIWCERGTFYIRNGGHFLVQGTDGKLFTPDAADLPPGTDVDTNFFAAIQGAEPVAASPTDGLHTIELTEAAWQSAAQGGKLVDVKRSMPGV